MLAAPGRRFWRATWRSLARATSLPYTTATRGAPPLRAFAGDFESRGIRSCKHGCDTAIAERGGRREVRGDSDSRFPAVPATPALSPPAPPSTPPRCAHAAPPSAASCCPLSAPRSRGTARRRRLAHPADSSSRTRSARDARTNLRKIRPGAGKSARSRRAPPVTRCASSKTPCPHSTTPRDAASSPILATRGLRNCSPRCHQRQSPPRPSANLPRRARRAAARRGGGEGAAARRARDRRRRRARARGGGLARGAARAGRRAAAAASARALGRRILLAALRGVRLCQREGQPRRLRRDLWPAVSRGQAAGRPRAAAAPAAKVLRAARAHDELGRRRAADGAGHRRAPGVGAPSRPLRYSVHVEPAAGDGFDARRSARRQYPAPAAVARRAVARAATAAGAAPDARVH